MSRFQQPIPDSQFILWAIRSDRPDPNHWSIFGSGERAVLEAVAADLRRDRGWPTLVLANGAYPAGATPGEG